MRQGGTSPISHRVLPDGCADIVFTTCSSKQDLQVAGPMTRFEDFEIPPGAVLVGARFHPGMWIDQFGVPGDRLTDQLSVLENFWGKRARTLFDQLMESTSPDRCLSILASSIQNGHSPTPLQRALAWMRVRRGMLSLDEVASHAGFSPRQFRRLCLQQTGLSPKLLARIFRFRRALSRIHLDTGRHAALAADCGYFDQSHFIAEFQQFTGRSPRDFLRS